VPKLEVVSPVEDEVVAAYEFDADSGATVSVSGFHGTQTYTLSNHDTNLLVRFTGVTDFVVSGPGDPMTKQRAEAPEGEEGPEESDAEYAQRVAAEAAAEANDKKAGKDKKVTLVDDQGTARTYTFVDEVAPKKASASQPAQHTEKVAEKK
jgi:hypothetical protein